MLRPVLSGILLALAVVEPAPAVDAAQPNQSLPCSTENLLARRVPVFRQDLRGNSALVTDGAAAQEGAQWDSPVAVVLETGAGSLTYDLGDEYPVSAFLVQADANDTYKILGSSDGASQSFKVLADIDIVPGHGLRTRTVTIASPEPVRFLRIGEGVGDSYYSIAEFQAFCHTPAPFPPKLRIVDAPPARLTPQPWYRFSWWQNSVSARFEMVLALLGCALLAWGLRLAQMNMVDIDKKLRDRLLIVVGVLSFGAYWNFGAGHFGNYVHYWEWYHYYVGSKYFKELSYDRLYDCAAVGDAEDPALRRRVELRKAMNLRTNFIESTSEALAHPERCKDHFSPQRWTAFKHDLAFFRSHLGVKRWEDAQTDHGYNATPVWNIAGTALANTGPASDTQLSILLLFDPAFALGMMAMIWWAFGWRTLCVALLIFGTNFPSRFYWTGGAFLRWDWLFYMVAGVCLMKKDRPIAGGFLLMYSALLRIFPAFLFVGPVMVAIQEFVRTRKIDGRYTRVLAGAGLGLALLMPASLVISGGIDGYRTFLQNTEKHASTPLTNYMGLRTIVAYRPSEAGHIMKNDKLDDPWAPWKLAKLRTFRDRMPFFFLAVLGYLVLLWYASRNSEPWVACALSATGILIGAELTCYYYSYLVVVALLYDKRFEVGVILSGVTAGTSFIDWAPTRFLPNTRTWSNLRMPTWLDEQYMWMSVITLIGFLWILYLWARRLPAPGVAAPAPLVEEGPSVPREGAATSRDNARGRRGRSPANKRKTT